jgi:ligand-binding SRPBCC domain-containing protein
MRFYFHTEQLLDRPARAVFAFFADPYNLPLLMPEWQKARIDETLILAPPGLGSPSSTNAVAGTGSQVTLSFRPVPQLPIRIRWEAEISEFAWNDYFCDRQLRGPFRYWNHCHHVEPAGSDHIEMTRIVDDLEYELPLGLAGRLAHRLFVRRQIERTFAFRQRQLARIMKQSVPSQPE